MEKDAGDGLSGEPYRVLEALAAGLRLEGGRFLAPPGPSGSTAVSGAAIAELRRLGYVTAPADNTSATITPEGATAFRAILRSVAAYSLRSPTISQIMSDQG